MARFRRLLAVGLGAVGAGVFYCANNNDNSIVLLAAQKFHDESLRSTRFHDQPKRSTKWDWNWDRCVHCFEVYIFCYVVLCYGKRMFVESNLMKHIPDSGGSQPSCYNPQREGKTTKDSKESWMKRDQPPLDISSLSDMGSTIWLGNVIQKEF